MSPEDDEEVRCAQCELPINPKMDAWKVISGICSECGKFHYIGVVHIVVCLQALLNEETVEWARYRRAGATGQN